MLVIRLFRIGKKNQPAFKMVVTDKRNPPRGGRFVEELGFWNPLTKEKNLKQDRIKHWLLVGAKPSASVYNLLISEKIIEGKKIPKHKKPKKTTTHPPPSQPKAGPLEKKIVPEEKKEAPTKEEKTVSEKTSEKPKEKKEEKTPQDRNTGIYI